MGQQTRDDLVAVGSSDQADGRQPEAQTLSLELGGTEAAICRVAAAPP